MQVGAAFKARRRAAAGSVAFNPYLAFPPSVTPNPSFKRTASPPLNSNVRRRSPHDEGCSQNANTRCEVARTRRAHCVHLACYVARSKHLDVKTTRSLRTHWPSRPACSSRRCLRVSAEQERLRISRVLPSGPPVPLRWRSAHRCSAFAGFVICPCFRYRASAASCRMNTSETTYPKLAVVAF